MTPARHQLTVNADYHQLYVLDSGAPLDASGRADFWTHEALARLLALGPGILGVSTGSYVVPLVLQVDAAAPREDFAAWDHVVDADLPLPSGKLIVHGCTQPREEGLHVAVAPGRYIARVCYGKLDSVVDEEGDDHYAVFLWPGARSGAAVVKRWPGAARFAPP
jgi:hypothetical protein